MCVIILSGILSGCSDKCCDCDKIISNGQSNLRLIRSWDNLWDGMAEPDGLDVYFYSQFQDFQNEKIYADTTNLFLTGGEYNVLAVSDNVNISGIEDFNTAKISLPCQRLDNRYLTTEVPLTVAASAAVSVDNDRVTECLVAPCPVVSVINFRFDIWTDSLVGEIKECKAELNGVATSKMLSGGKDVNAILASLPFTAVKTAKGVFDKRVSILGLSGNNTLDISVTSGDETKNTSVNLTGLFDFSLSPIQNCVIQIRIEADLVTTVIESISIADWNEGMNDNIELQK